MVKERVLNEGLYEYIKNFERGVELSFDRVKHDLKRYDERLNEFSKNLESNPSNKDLTDKEKESLNEKIEITQTKLKELSDFVKGQSQQDDKNFKGRFFSKEKENEITSKFENFQEKFNNLSKEFISINSKIGNKDKEIIEQIEKNKKQVEEVLSNNFKLQVDIEAAKKDILKNSSKETLFTEISLKYKKLEDDIRKNSMILIKFNSLSSKFDLLTKDFLRVTSILEGRKLKIRNLSREEEKSIHSKLRFQGDKLRNYSEELNRFKESIVNTDRDIFTKITQTNKKVDDSIKENMKTQTELSIAKRDIIKLNSAENHYSVLTKKYKMLEHEFKKNNLILNENKNLSYQLKDLEKKYSSLDKVHKEIKNVDNKIEYAIRDLNSSMVRLEEKISSNKKENIVLSSNLDVKGKKMNMLSKEIDRNRNEVIEQKKELIGKMNEIERRVEYTQTESRKNIDSFSKESKKILNKMNFSERNIHSFFRDIDVLKEDIKSDKKQSKQELNTLSNRLELVVGKYVSLEKEVKKSRVDLDIKSLDLKINNVIQELKKDKMSKDKENMKLIQSNSLLLNRIEKLEKENNILEMEREKIRKVFDKVDKISKRITDLSTDIGNEKLLTSNHNSQVLAKLNMNSKKIESAFGKIESVGNSLTKKAERREVLSKNDEKRFMNILDRGKKDMNKLETKFEIIDKYYRANKEIFTQLENVISHIFIKKELLFRNNVVPEGKIFNNLTEELELFSKINNEYLKINRKMKETLNDKTQETKMIKNKIRGLISKSSDSSKRVQKKISNLKKTPNSKKTSKVKRDPSEIKKVAKYVLTTKK